MKKHIITNINFFSDKITVVDEMHIRRELKKLDLYCYLFRQRNNRLLFEFNTKEDLNMYKLCAEPCSMLGIDCKVKE